MAPGDGILPNITPAFSHGLLDKKINDTPACRLNPSLQVGITQKRACTTHIRQCMRPPVEDPQADNTVSRHMVRSSPAHPQIQLDSFD